MAKIERKYLAHFINAAENGAPADYQRLGHDLQEFTPEMAASVDVKKNILGQTSVLISGYEKTAAVQPYYAEAGTALFEKLQSIIDGNLILDDLKTDVVEVKLWEEADSEKGYPCVKETVYLEVTGYGGDTTGYQIPFTIHYTGEKVSGFFKPETRTFTAAA